jgi:hypothetical protein
MVLAAYGPALRAGFIWDDDDYVTENPLLHTPDGFERIWLSMDAPSQYFPLVYTAFRIEYGLWGLDPFGYHLINVLFHAANALLLWLLLRRLDISGAWFAAAVFALHPVHVESVAWITERKNVMSLFFSLASRAAFLCGLADLLRARALEQSHGLYVTRRAAALALAARISDRSASRRARHAVFRARCGAGCRHYLLGASPHRNGGRSIQHLVR